MVDLDLPMAVTRLDRRLTARDLDSLPHEWDTLYELIGGVLFMSTKPSPHHQAVIANLVHALLSAVRQMGGVVLPESGLVWDDDGEDNVAPDLAIVLPPVPRKDDKLRRTPEICVEVLSPGKENRKRDLEAKRALYWRRGAKEYWVVDPENDCLLRLTRGARKWREERLLPSDTLKSPLIEGWAGVKVSELLAYP